MDSRKETTLCGLICSGIFSHNYTTSIHIIKNECEYYNTAFTKEKETKSRFNTVKQSFHHLDSLQKQSFHSISVVHVGLSYSREFPQPPPPPSTQRSSAPCHLKNICASWIDSHSFHLTRQQSYIPPLMDLVVILKMEKIAKQQHVKKQSSHFSPESRCDATKEAYSPYDVSLLQEKPIPNLFIWNYRVSDGVGEPF